jgi:phage terminase large subunit
MSNVEVIIPLKVYLPAYRHLNASDADIDLLWGGRDSGKSHYIAQRLIKKCLSEPYFRCLLVKKTFNSIHDSQWQTLKDVVNEWGLSQLFKFKESPLSIECVNGNKFLARGCDDPGTLKSIKDPTDVWYEELNQLTLQDFLTVTTTLRSNKAKIHQYGSFNPETDEPYEQFWLYKVFFSTYSGDLYSNFSSTWSIDLPGSEKYEFKYTCTFTTYKDNRYSTPERRAFLEQLSIIDPYYYTVYTLGQWGNIKIGAPFIFTFDRAKHIIKGLQPIPHLPIILSFDFNVDPITCISGQIKGFEYAAVLDEFRILNSDIEEICERIVVTYPDSMFLVTGDASGQNRIAIKKDLDYYKVIKRILKLGIAQIKLPAANPPIKKTRLLCNTLLSKHPNYHFSDRVPYLITDIENTEVDEHGGINVSKDKHVGHLFACWRYFNFTFLYKFIDLKMEAEAPIIIQEKEINPIYTIRRNG